MSLVQRQDSLSLEQQQRIDEICLAFEDQWLAGQRPLIEHQLPHVESGVRPALLRELLRIELEYRRAMAEVPLAEDYRARFPHRESVIEQAFAWMAEHAIALRFPAGQCIGRYRVRARIGTGAFGTVYRAWDERLEREVAVKVPHRSHLRSDQARQRLVSEARAVARLDHPRIVAVYDAGQLDDGTVYVVMQYVAGQSLAERLRKEELSPDEAVTIALEVTQALGCAHHQGIVHRDLKPGNILLDTQGVAHVADFGLALQEDDPHARPGEYAGTPSYMAPEQLEGNVTGTDGRADIWALGVVLYQMLSGHAPFRATTRREMATEVQRRDPKPLRQWNPRLPRSLERICRRCLAPNPGDRYASARDLEDALRQWQVRRRVDRLWKPALAGLLVLLAIVVGTLLVRDEPADPRLDASPLTAKVELLVWPAAPAPYTEFRLSDTNGRLALKPHDHVRLEVQLNRPAYLYVVWLDTRGAALPVYPWQQGDWTLRPRSESPCALLALPPQLDDAWPMGEGPAGMETLLLLARQTCLPAHIDLPELLHELPADSLPPGQFALHFAGQGTGPARVFRAGKKRAPLLDRVDSISAPVRRLHQQIVTTLRPHFDLIQGVSFPVLGSEPVPARASARPAPGTADTLGSSASP